MAIGPEPRPAARMARARGPSAGFTLAEVLAAMLVLAVGLLALQALGVTAARATSTAGRSTQAVAGAVERMEEAHHELARGALPAAFSCELASGDRITRGVVVLEPGTLARVEVEVVLADRGPVMAPVALRTHVYSPTGFGPPQPPAPCP
jgi:prepilin-type N-terminal cleavage/methylation domain-containing protein